MKYIIEICKVCGRVGVMANFWWDDPVTKETVCQNGEGDDCYMWVIRCLVRLNERTTRR